MPRPRERVCLQDGLKLDLNRLARNGFIRLGARSGPIGIHWYSIYWDTQLASGLITADMSGPQEGWFRTPRRFQRADYASRPSPTFRRPTMVFHVPRHERASVGTMEATGRKPILESSSLGATSCLRLAVQRPR